MENLYSKAENEIYTCTRACQATSKVPPWQMVSSMISRVQEENVQTLLTILADEGEGEYIAMKWLNVLKKKAERFRRQRREHIELQEENATEVCMFG